MDVKRASPDLVSRGPSPSLPELVHKYKLRMPEALSPANAEDIAKVCKAILDGSTAEVEQLLRADISFGAAGEIYRATVFRDGVVEKIHQEAMALLSKKRGTAKTPSYATSPIDVPRSLSASSSLL